MSDSFSIEKAAKDTTVNKSSGFLARLFKNRLHAQFQNIKHGCIILYDNYIYINYFTKTEKGRVFFNLTYSKQGFFKNRIQEIF